MSGVSDWDAMLVSRYIKPESAQHALMERIPFVGIIPKEFNITGDLLALPLITIQNRKRSRVYATASASSQNTTVQKFSVSPVNDYGFARWQDNQMRESRNKGEHAMLEVMETEMDGMLSTLSGSLGRGVFGNVGGSVARFSAISSDVATLYNREDAIHFEPGDQICVASTDGTSGSLRDSGAAATVESVAPLAGTVTATAAWGTAISGAVADDYAFFEGDFGASVSGLGGWIPLAAPTDTFHGIARTAAQIRTGGWRYSGGGLLPEDMIKRACAYGRQVTNGLSMPSYAVMNDVTLADFESSMQNKTFSTVRYLSIPPRVYHLVCCNRPVPSINSCLHTLELR